LLLWIGVGDETKWLTFFVVKNWFRRWGCRLATFDSRDACLQILVGRGWQVAGEAADGHEVLGREYLWHGLRRLDLDLVRTAVRSVDEVVDGAVLDLEMALFGEDSCDLSVGLAPLAKVANEIAVGFELGTRRTLGYLVENGL